MSENKKYYWLKLKDNFFDSEEMKIIEAQNNSSAYQILYLKMCLLSLKNDGCLSFKGCLPYDFKMLSTILRIDIDTVRVGLELFTTLGLVEKLDSGIMFMSDIESLIGKGSSEADRKVLFRERIKNQRLLEGGGQTSAKRPPEIEIEKEIDNTSKKKESKKKLTEDTDEQFNLFWNVYDNKKGKYKTFTLWSKLSQDERDEVVLSVPNYLLYLKSKNLTFKYNPENYIKDRRYKDYLVAEKKKFVDQYANM